MHKFLEKIKKLETKPRVIKNFLNDEEVKLFKKLYEELPIEINNKRQKIVKKKWDIRFQKELQINYIKKL